MKLFEQFKIKKPKNQSEHYELFVEGDWNDGDYVHRKEIIDKNVLENNDYLLYFISYISTWCGCRWNQDDKRFNETDDWKKFFADSDIRWDYLPSVYDNDIHTVTEVKLYYVSNGIQYPVEIPNFDSLFDNEDDKKRKVLDSKT